MLDEDLKIKSLEDLIDKIDETRRLMHNSVEIAENWIPNATDAEEALLYALALQANLRALFENDTTTWEKVLTDSYEDGKSVEAYKKMVEFGLLEATKVLQE